MSWKPAQKKSVSDVLLWLAFSCEEFLGCFHDVTSGGLRLVQYAYLLDGIH
jgi:hypothetical protein